MTTSNLGFGRIVATNSAGTATLTPAGVRSSSGGVVLGGVIGVSPASFNVSGNANASYSITLPLEAQLTTGFQTMSVSGFTSSPSGSGNLGPAGSQVVYLGATLHVGASQATGSYSGTFVVIVSYN